MKQLQAGFTFVELMIVISILAILALVTIIEFREILPRANDTQRQNDVATIASHLETYFQKNGEYPESSHRAGEPPYWSWPTNGNLGYMSHAKETLGIDNDDILISPTPDVNTKAEFQEYSVRPYSWMSTTSSDRLPNFYFYWVPGETFDIYPNIEMPPKLRDTFILTYTKEATDGPKSVSICGRGKNINTSKATIDAVKSNLPTFNPAVCSNF